VVEQKFQWGNLESRNDFQSGTERRSRSLLEYLLTACQPYKHSKKKGERKHRGKRGGQRLINQEEGIHFILERTTTLSKKDKTKKKEVRQQPRSKEKRRKGWNAGERKVNNHLYSTQKKGK